MQLALSILVPLALAAVAHPLERRLGKAASILLALGPAALFVGFLSRASDPARLPLWEDRAWLSAVDARLSFYLDGLGLAFALLITGIGSLIILYAGAYMSDAGRGRLLTFLFLFMASMLGLVLAGNLILLFVFWELTSLSSFLLIGFDHESKAARRAALQALLVTGTGGLALLASFVLMTIAAGTASVPDLLRHGSLAHDARYPLILGLFLLGAFTKSAQFPFHFWLPNAMEAPTPVSAYLHSATMVKAGVFALARFTPVLADSDAWTLALGVAGTITMVLGAYLALHESDYKRILAFSTVSMLGTLVLLLGVGTRTAVEASVVLLFGHALYKGALFMVAGVVYHEAGTRDVDALGGLRRSMPITAVAAVLAGLSLAGLAPLFSFLGKELLLEALLHARVGAPLLTVMAAFAAMLLVGVAWVTGIRPFVGPARPTPKSPHDPPWPMLVGPLVLSTMGLLFGVFPGLLEHHLLVPAAQAVQGEVHTIGLVLWHGFTPTLLLSMAILAGGAAAYRYWRGVHRRVNNYDRWIREAGDRAYDAALAGLVRGAAGLTALIQEQRLRTHVGLILLTAAALVLAGGLLGLGAVAIPLELPWHEVILLGVMVTAALVTATTRSRLAAVMALGVMGYALAVLFLLYSAPDLAITQFLFETVMLIVFLAVLQRLPRFVQPASRLGTMRRMLVAALVGLAFFATFLVIDVAAPGDASAYFGEHSVEKGKGRNVVNVVLVDFRALDTLGEITVLAIAGVGVWALLRRTPEEGGKA